MNTIKVFDTACAALQANFGVTVQARSGKHNRRWYLLTSVHTKHTSIELTEVSDNEIKVQATATLPNTFISITAIEYNITSASIAHAIKSLRYDIERIERACNLYAQGE